MSSIENREFIFIDNYDEYGEIFFHYAQRERDEKPLMPVLKSHRTKKDNIDEYVLIPGFLDINSRFYECPFQYYHFQLFKITQIEDYNGSFPYKTTLNVYFILFSKSSPDHQKYKLTLVNQDSSVLDFMIVSSIANRFNEFIDSNYDINNINLTERKREDFYLKEREIIIEPINKLDIELFENSKGSRKPGGDDKFWDEAELKNLPTDPYIRHLIARTIEQRWKNVTLKDDYIIFEFNHESAYSPAHKRRKKEKDTLPVINNIRDCLLIDMSSEFNSIDHFSYNIQG